MSPRLIPPTPAATVLKAFDALGFVRVRQSGSHVRLRHPDGRAVTIPDHGRKDLKTGTLHGILRQARVPVQDFLTALP
ncbi:type II toxin-antitoxin system HicA family toxin [Actinocorallia sp. A-T 12471]|uniref:type II toxin-antitoxin system HicA family toxin n=1 Tax=Actinocorallia sp. A-T 12471 TaxID=3089813 RepID=UPI0029D3AA76|nr:type II toxin-antitoxin system HicA family toxin [Actinocorallia sp. A-T 12471]MDX6739775.1 type II toxin-antitoxin system HicA family toxin [Actinocorallia sp. A-T 12471]